MAKCKAKEETNNQQERRAKAKGRYYEGHCPQV